MGYFFVTLVCKILTYVEYAAVLPPAKASLLSAQYSTFPVIPSHSQPFSAVLSRSQLFSANLSPRCHLR